MKSGILLTIAACAGWGFAFIGPVILHGWPGYAVAAGRYIAYGLWSLAVLGFVRLRKPASRRTGSEWRAALWLTLSGNLVYYVLLSIAVQRAGAYLPTLIIGLLPLTVSMAGRLRARQPLTPRYGFALLLIFLGLLLAHGPQPGEGDTNPSDPLGLVCAFAALALWTAYGVSNSEWLQAHPHISGTVWSSMQGAAALPFALALLTTTSDAPAGASWPLFIGISLVLGIVTSWASNTAWNLASARLPTSLLGPLIVFETIFGLSYAAIWSRAMPTLSLLAGTVLLIGGVVLALRERVPAMTSEGA